MSKNKKRQLQKLQYLNQFNGIFRKLKRKYAGKQLIPQ